MHTFSFCTSKSAQCAQRVNKKRNIQYSVFWYRVVLAGYTNCLDKVRVNTIASRNCNFELISADGLLTLKLRLWIRFSWVACQVQFCFGVKVDIFEERRTQECGVKTYTLQTCAPRYSVMLQTSLPALSSTPSTIQTPRLSRLGHTVDLLLFYCWSTIAVLYYSRSSC